MSDDNFSTAPGDAEKQPQTEPSPVDAEAIAVPAGEKVCPVCRESNPSESVYCGKCGFKFLDTGAPDKKICPGCNSVNDPASQYCYKCGLKLPDRASTEFRYAGFWIRLLAYIIDGILLNIITGIIEIVLLVAIFKSDFELWFDIANPNMFYDSMPASFWLFYGISILVSYIIQMVYHTIAIGKWGKTIGKAAIGVKVVRTDGTRVSYWRAFGRYWAYVLNGFTLNIGFLVIAWTSKKQGLHDMICDTIVVKTN
jgi:uncharacterized RDD family membrane protein YckC/ribosomal protein L40E